MCVIVGVFVMMRIRMFAFMYSDSWGVITCVNLSESVCGRVQQFNWN
jgi:hypothetical protein